MTFKTWAELGEINRPSVEQRMASKGLVSGLANPSSFLLDFLGAAPSSTGLDVSEATAMQSMAVYACIKVLAETMATLPLPVYQAIEGGGKVRAERHPLYRILHDAPNPEMTSAEFRSTMMTHLMLWGNAYAEIERDLAGRPVALWPLRPDRMQIWRSLQEPLYELEYWYSLYRGGVAILAPEQILHLKNLSIDGIRGMSPIAHQREAVGLTLGLEQYAGRFFGNDSSPGGFLSSPLKLSEEARKRIKDGWESTHRGLDNAHRLAVLEEGISFQKIGIPPEEAQFIQSRGYQLAEIARMYRVPLHLLNSLERVTHANIEHMGIDYVTHTVRPLCVNWEQSIAQKLFTVAESGTYFAEFNVDALLRGDLASRYASYAIGRQNGFLNVDEIRDKENLNPLPDGKGQEYLTPLNMVQSGSTPVPGPDTTDPGGDDVPDDAEARSAGVQKRWLASEIDRIVRIERERVLQSAQKLLVKGDLRGFQRFLVEFYGEKLPPMFQERLAPVFGDKAEYAQEYIADLAVRHSQTALKAAQDALVNQNGHSLETIEALYGPSGALYSASRAIDAHTRRFFGRMMDMEPDGDESPTTAAPQVNFLPGSIVINPPSVTVPVTIEAPQAVVIPAPQITNSFEGDTINVAPAQVTIEPPDIINQIDVQPAQANVTVEGDTITVEPAQVQVPVTIEGDTITNQVQQPDVTILPAEITVNVPTPEPSRGIQVLYDGAGKVIGTAPRSAPKVEDAKAKPKAKK